MSRDKAIKTIQKLIRLHLAGHGFHVEQQSQQWQWRRHDGAAHPAADEIGAILAAAEALIRTSLGKNAA